MHIKYKGCEEALVQWKYDNEQSKFIIYDKEEQTVFEFVPELDIDAEFEICNFQMEILHNKRNDHVENDIYPVFVSKKRIGWIFPIQALLSTEHDQSSNQYFLKYAYVALCLLINNIESDEQIEIPEQFNLEDYYDCMDSVLILDTENCRSIDNFNLDDYVVSLFKLGYSFHGIGNISSTIEKPNRRLNLKAQSTELNKIPYIVQLFKKQIPGEQIQQEDEDALITNVPEGFSTFHIYYQLIELLITVIFEKKFKDFVNCLNEDAGKLFDERDKLDKMVSEKRRVIWLFNSFTTVSEENKRMLDEECVKLLAVCRKKYTYKVAEDLYAVRCLLVHNLYILSDEGNFILKELNNCFLDVLIDMVMTFHTPRESEEE